MANKFLAMIAGMDTSAFDKVQVSSCFMLTDIFSFQTWYLIPRDEEHWLTPLAGVGHEAFMESRAKGAATMRKSDDPRHKHFDQIVEFPNVESQPSSEQYYGFKGEIFKMFFDYEKKTAKSPASITQIKLSLSLDQIDGWLHDVHNTGGDASKLPDQIYRQFIQRELIRGAKNQRAAKVGYGVREIASDKDGNVIIDRAVGKARKVS